MRLRKLRENLGYSQSDLEDITGVPQSTISRLERKDIMSARERIIEDALMQRLIEHYNSEVKRNGN